MITRELLRKQIRAIIKQNPEFKGTRFSTDVDWRGECHWIDIYGKTTGRVNLTIKNLSASDVYWIAKNDEHPVTMRESALSDYLKESISIANKTD